MQHLAKTYFYAERLKDCLKVDKRVFLTCHRNFKNENFKNNALFTIDHKFFGTAYTVTICEQARKNVTKFSTNPAYNLYKKQDAEELVDAVRILVNSYKRSKIKVYTMFLH